MLEVKGEAEEGKIEGSGEGADEASRWAEGSGSGEMRKESGRGNRGNGRMGRGVVGVDRRLKRRRKEEKGRRKWKKRSAA